jgi:hypothetical protein
MTSRQKNKRRTKKDLEDPSGKAVVLTTVSRGGRDNKLSIGRLPVPPRAYTKLHFWAVKALSNAAANFANVRMTPTLAYDIDPSLGSTAMPFFSELGAIYRYYRCLGSQITVNFVNQGDVTACQGIVCPVNSDPGANSLSFVNYFSNPLSKKSSFGALSGMSVAKVSGSAKTDMFAGAKWTGAFDAYCGFTTGSPNPTNNWYWYIGFYCQPAMTNGVWAFIDLAVDLCFFEEQLPST